MARIGLHDIPVGSQLLIGARVDLTTAWDDTGPGVNETLVAGDGLICIPGGLPRIQVEPAENTAAPTGSGAGAVAPLQRPGVKAVERVTGNLPLEYGYGVTAMERIIMGYCGTDTVSDNADGSFGHQGIMEAWSDTVLTLAWYDNRIVHDLLVKPVSLGLEFSTGKPLCNVGIVGKQEIRDDSGPNTIASMTALYPDLLPSSFSARTIKHPQVIEGLPRVWLNAAGSGALSASDQLLDVTNVTVETVRAYRERVGNRNGPRVDEPAAGGFMTFAGTISFGVASQADNFGIVREYQSMIDYADVKASIVFEGDQISAGPSSYGLDIEMPLAKLGTDGIDDLTSADTPEVTVPFVCHRGYTTPTGMQWPQPTITITNEIATDLTQ